MFILLISNHTVFLVQFGINLHLWVFQKAEIALAEAARAISAFWKTHSCKLIPNWTRNRMITYTNITPYLNTGVLNIGIGAKTLCIACEQWMDNTDNLGNRFQLYKGSHYIWEILLTTHNILDFSCTPNQNTGFNWNLQLSNFTCSFRWQHRSFFLKSQPQKEACLGNANFLSLTTKVWFRSIHLRKVEFTM